MAYNRLIGDIGEDIACVWLKKQNFLILERNYLKKYGEIDIVAVKDNIIHFFEVKSGTKGEKGHRPEENVHNLKIQRLKRVIQTYLTERKYGLDAEFQFHIVVVSMNLSTHRARVKLMENIIL